MGSLGSRGGRSSSSGGNSSVHIEGGSLSGVFSEITDGSSKGGEDD